MDVVAAGVRRGEKIDYPGGAHIVNHIPNGQDTASLGQAGLLSDTTDSLLEDRRDLGGRSLRIGGVAPGEDAGDGCGISCLGRWELAGSPKM